MLLFSFYKISFLCKINATQSGMLRKLRETTMRQFSISVAALAAFGFMLTAAQADNLLGAPPKNGNQCFKFSAPDQVREARFGSWGPCPQTASAAVAPAPKASKRAASR
jgi:hypothetical protein